MHTLKFKLAMIGTLVVLLAAVFIVMTLTENRLGMPEAIFIDDENTDTDSADVPVMAVTDSEKTNKDTEKNISKNKKNGKDINFSEESYFYNDTINLEITTGNNDVNEIYYTIDGSLPTSDEAKIYDEPVTLKKSSTSGKVKGYTVKACGKLSDGTYTDIFTHTYLISEKIDERFDVLVFSLSTDPYNLYDYDYGIFVEGKLRDDYKKETGDYNPDPPAPANYNIRGTESERPVYVELFDTDGNVLLSQNAGMRTFGGWSRAMEQKSIKLYARSEYDEKKSTFDYDFFPDATDLNGISITKYKRIVLRNNANDNPFAFLRDETIQDMAGLTTLQDTQGARAAAVFLNGEYYGFVWVKQVYDDNYLDDMNGIKDGEWAILSGGEHYKMNDEVDPFVESAIENYNGLYQEYSNKDFSDDSVYNEFCKLVDVENFLTYYAVQTYVANGDWPSGNYKVYKYYGDTSLSPYQNNTADGKWRWLLYDTDFGLGLYDCSPSEKSLGIILGKYGHDENKRSDLLCALLARDDVKEQFIRIFCDLINYQYSPDNVSSTVHAREALRYKEVAYNFKYGGAQLKNSWSNINRANEEVDKIIRFGRLRPSQIKKQIVDYLEIENVGYTVNVKKNENADIKVNSCLIDDNSKDFSGFYYDINNVTLSAQIEVGYEFSHWLINGKAVNEQSVVLTKNNAANEKIDIELVTIQAEGIYPLVTLIDYEGDMDYVQIYNPYQSDLNLKKFYISDDPDNLYKQSLADFTLHSGDTLNLYCKNYTSSDALGGFALGFNLKNGETLFITDGNGDTVHSIYLPKINKKHIYVLNLRTGEYYDTLRE